MILYPAIDLKNGECVRLKLGDMDQATVFNDDPAAQARQFEAQGFQWLHVVDLDGAFAGKPANAAAVTAILRAVTLPIQLGGGIRTMAQVEEWLHLGVRRIILGTAALKAPDLVRQACRDFPGRVAVGIDARQGKVAVEGWAETSELTALELAK
ncbi:MAG: 1-(5-phosphoribosyl)-5-((5-phosphoribosylamino)methylideneamino)imidazole-4-carboxamide isomerase, partial [Alphaproteobacteria bacterium]|nr:1-(5-phosphoribosyl)-5-((5-phosphoribosylamino)methylideneamino)imidazole-4-carboxamide isomerase [Alphaproteobacteria bacterium]